MGKKSGLVDKLVAKKKKKRELCLDLNSGSGMFVNKSSTESNSLVDDILKVKQVNKPKKLKAINPISNPKEFAMFDIDTKTNFDDLQFSSSNNNNNINITKSEDIQPESKQSNITKLEAIKPKKETNNTKLDNIKPNNIKLDNITVSSKIEIDKPINNITDNQLSEIITETQTNTEHKKDQKDNKELKYNKNVSRFSNSNIINLSKQRYNKLLDKENALMKKIQYKNNQIEKMKSQQSELNYIKKSDDERRKLVELEKQLHKIEKIKFLHQKKLSIEKYKQNIEQYNKMIQQQTNQIIEYTNSVKNSTMKNQVVRNNPEVRNPIIKSNDLKNEVNYKIKKLITPDYNIDVINKITTSRNILYKQIIDKYKNNLLCIKNIENNKYILKQDYFINNIDRLVRILDISEKQWNTLYNTEKFNFLFTIR